VDTARLVDVGRREGVAVEHQPLRFEEVALVADGGRQADDELGQQRVLDAEDDLVVDRRVEVRVGEERLDHLRRIERVVGAVGEEDADVAADLVDLGAAVAVQIS
jgi:hypothetical protein